MRLSFFLSFFRFYLKMILARQRPYWISLCCSVQPSVKYSSQRYGSFAMAGWAEGVGRGGGPRRRRRRRRRRGGRKRGGGGRTGVAWGTERVGGGEEGWGWGRGVRRNKKRRPFFSLRYIFFPARCHWTGEKKRRRHWSAPPAGGRPAVHQWRRLFFSPRSSFPSFFFSFFDSHFRLHSEFLVVSSCTESYRVFFLFSYSRTAALLSVLPTAATAPSIVSLTIRPPSFLRFLPFDSTV